MFITSSSIAFLFPLHTGFVKYMFLFLSFCCIIFAFSLPLFHWHIGALNFPRLTSPSLHHLIFSTWTGTTRAFNSRKVQIWKTRRIHLWLGFVLLDFLTTTFSSLDNNCKIFASSSEGMQSAGRQIYGDNKSLQKPLKCPFEQPLDSKYLWNIQIQKQKPSIRLFATKKLQSEN